MELIVGVGDRPVSNKTFIKKIKCFQVLLKGKSVT